MKNQSNNEKRLENASLNSNRTINRDVILQWLKEDIEFLRKKARCKNPIKNPIRVKLLRASIYGCSIILQALKDKEIEDLTEEIEKIKNHLGVK